MTIKELSQLFWLNREIADLQRRAADIEERTGSPSSPDLSGMPKGGGTGTGKVEAGAIECADLYAQIVEMQHKCEHERERLTQYINDIPDSFIRQIFRCKFLDCMTWDAVAGQLPGVYTGSGVRKKVTRYLNENPEKSES